jgi:hypothetical protein
VIISPDDSGLLAYHCLRCWDTHDVPVKDIVWFNPDSMIASARVSGLVQRVEIGRFIFLAVLKTTAERLRRLLPEHLHAKIDDSL